MKSHLGMDLRHGLTFSHPPESFKHIQKRNQLHKTAKSHQQHCDGNLYTRKQSSQHLKKIKLDQICLTGSTLLTTRIPDELHIPPPVRKLVMLDAAHEIKHLTGHRLDSAHC